MIVKAPLKRIYIEDGILYILTEKAYIPCEKTMPKTCEFEIKFDGKVFCGGLPAFEVCPGIFE